MAGSKLRVYFTVDTETSMGGAWTNSEYSPVPLDGPVFGAIGAKFYGIPLIMDILEEHGFRATFFTEVFCAPILGHEELRKVFRTIHSRGHDPQLHLHPIYRFYKDSLSGCPRREIDLMFQLSEGEQRQLIGEGVSLFQQLSGKSPRAYRAGCYGASEVTLRALRANGIEIDSSYNLAFLNNTCGFEASCLNAPALIEGVYEFPVTVFRASSSARFKPLEISAVSVTEILTTIGKLQARGCQDVVLVLHSFSLLKNISMRYERYRPDQIVIQRLRDLCGALAERSAEIEVRILGDADLPSISLQQPQVVPSIGWLQPSMRKIVQGINRLSWV